MSVPLSSLPVRRARTLLANAPESGGLFDLNRVEGRVVEVSEAGFFGALSALCPLLVQVQARGEAVAWVAGGASIFFPPDLAFRGVDVGGVSVVRAPGTKAALVAADGLLRSGAFGLIVVDGLVSVEEGALGRLARVAEDRRTVLLFLTRKKSGDASLGTQVSLRGAVSRGADGQTEWEIVRDKRFGPPSRQKVGIHGPFGLY